jgi:signal transduction histidine kinase
MDDKLTAIEDEFSFTLGEGSRWLERVVVRLLFATAITVETTGLLLVIFVTRGIKRGLTEIIRAAKSFSAGVLSARAKVLSQDEIGIVANSFNEMADFVQMRVTELAAARSEAERANQAKSKFLAAASHDLRQPVQSLVLLMALVERQIAANPEARSTLAMMQKAVDGLNSLLTAILDVSQLDAGVEAHPEPVDLAAMLRRLALEYEPKADEVGLVLRVAAPGLWASTDPGLLERAIRNLIDNAIRYTRTGGVLLGLRRRNGRVRIDVVDTGIGIPRERQADTFEEFVQISNPGRQLGLGLGFDSRSSTGSRNSSAQPSKSVPVSGGDRASLCCCRSPVRVTRRWSKTRPSLRIQADECSSLKIIQSCCRASKQRWLSGATRRSRPRREKKRFAWRRTNVGDSAPS